MSLPIRKCSVPINHEDSPIISFNVPLPKDMAGKVKLTTISTKTEIRYNKRQDKNEGAQFCSPAYKITRFWKAKAIEDNQDVEIEHVLQDNTSEDSLKNTEYEYSSSETPVDPVSTTLPEESLQDDILHKEPVNYQNLDPRLEKRKSGIKFLNSKSFTPISSLYRKASGISNKAKERESPPLVQNSKKHSTDSTSTYCDFASEYRRRRDYFDSSALSSEERSSSSSTASDLVRQKNEEKAQYKDKEPAYMEKALYMYDPNNMGIEPNMNVYKNRSAKKTFMNDLEEETSSGSSTVIENSSEGLKVYRLLNVEKKLSYVSTESPNVIVSPEAVIKRYRTVENPIVSCNSVKYFTGFEKVFHDPLMNLGIFFSQNFDIPNRSETRVQTTLVSQIVDPNEVGEIEFNNFINSHDIEEEIPIHFTKLSGTQVGKNDPRILRVADVITVAQIRKVTPDQLESRI